MTDYSDLNQIIAGVVMLGAFFGALRVTLRASPPPCTERRKCACGERFMVSEGDDSDECPACRAGIGEWMII
jgi:hypothetical protein